MHLRVLLEIDDGYSGETTMKLELHTRTGVYPLTYTVNKYTQSRVNHFIALRRPGKALALLKAEGVKKETEDEYE